MIFAVTNSTVQTLRVFCVFECLTAIAGFIWGGISIWTHRPSMSKKTYAAVTVTIAAFIGALTSAMFTEIGRFLDASKFTWRLPLNSCFSALAIAGIFLFSLSGFSPPIRPLPGVTRNPPMIAATSLLVLFVSTTCIMVAFQESKTARVVNETRSLLLDHPPVHVVTQQTVCDDEATLGMVPSPDCRNP